MPRCRNEFRDEYLCGDHTIYLKKDKNNYIGNLHESVMHNIIDKLDVLDVLKMRQCNKGLRDLIDKTTVIRSSIRTHGQLNSFCRAVLKSKYDLLARTVKKNDKGVIQRAIIYSIYTKRNDVAKYLIEGHSFLNDSSACRCCLLRADSIFCGNCYSCCSEFIKDDDAGDYEINMTNLLNLACMANNLSMVKYLMDTYNLRWTQFDISASLKKESLDVLEYLCKNKGARIYHARVLRCLNNIFYQNKTKYLEELLERGIIRLGAIFSQPLVNMLMYPDCDRKTFIRIIDKYGSKRLMRNLFKAAFHYKLEKVVKTILDISKNVVVSERHFKHMENTFWKNMLDIEIMLVNKWELQKRSV